MYSNKLDTHDPPSPHLFQSGQATKSQMLHVSNNARPPCSQAGGGLTWGCKMTTFFLCLFLYLYILPLSFRSSPPPQNELLLLACYSYIQRNSILHPHQHPISAYNYIESFTKLSLLICAAVASEPNLTPHANHHHTKNKEKKKRKKRKKSLSSTYNKKRHQA